MSFKGTILAEIERCYTVAQIPIDGKQSLFFGSDGVSSNGYMFSGENFTEKETVWENSGGCMSIKQVPNSTNEILVLQEFYLGNSPSYSKIVWYKKENKQWTRKDLLHLPFTHRMDVIEIDGKRIVLLATVSHYKTNKEDWSHPGSVYCFELPNSFHDNFNINPTQILDGLHWNHGYFRDNYNIYVSGKEGVFHLNIKDANYNNWNFTQVYDQPTSDIVLTDLNGDGVKEMVAIYDFHGNQFDVLELQENEYKIVYSYNKECEIIHGLGEVKIGTNNKVVVGVRKGKGNLLLLSYDGTQYTCEPIDTGRGPINLSVFYKDEIPMIAVANHTSNTAMLYQYIKE